MTDPAKTTAFSRRTLTGLAAAGVGVPLLAACSSDDPQSATDTSSGSTTAGGSTASTPSTPSTPSDSATAAPSESSGGAAPKGLTSTRDIEVGGGSIFADAEVVITQPAKGEFRAFSAVCTHQGCIVASVSDGTINCDCHGSQFSIETGEPESGPASAPLEEVRVTVTGDQISLA